MSRQQGSQILAYLKSVDNELNQNGDTILLWSELFHSLNMQTSFSDNEKRLFKRIFTRMSNSDKAREEFLKRLKAFMKKKPKVMTRFLENVLPPNFFPRSLHRYADLKHISFILNYLRFMLFGIPTKSFQQQLANYAEGIDQFVFLSPSGSPDGKGMRSSNSSSSSGDRSPSRQPYMPLQHVVRRSQFLSDKDYQSLLTTSKVAKDQLRHRQKQYKRITSRLGDELRRLGVHEKVFQKFTPEELKIPTLPVDRFHSGLIARSELPIGNFKRDRLVYSSRRNKFYWLLSQREFFIETHVRRLIGENFKRMFGTETFSDNYF